MNTRQPERNPTQQKKIFCPAQNKNIGQKGALRKKTFKDSFAPAVCELLNVVCWIHVQ